MSQRKRLLQKLNDLCLALQILRSVLLLPFRRNCIASKRRPKKIIGHGHVLHLPGEKLNLSSGIASAAATNSFSMPLIWLSTTEAMVGAAGAACCAVAAAGAAPDAAAFFTPDFNAIAQKPSTAKATTNIRVRFIAVCLLRLYLPKSKSSLPAIPTPTNPIEAPATANPVNLKTRTFASLFPLRPRKPCSSNRIQSNSVPVARYAPQRAARLEAARKIIIIRERTPHRTHRRSKR